MNVKDYIENEKYYIEKDMDIEGFNREGLQADLDFLESLTDEDIKKIQNDVDSDSELSNEIDNLVREAIHYWVYHYKKESE